MARALWTRADCCCVCEFDDCSTMVLADTRVRSKKYQLIQTQTDGLVGSFEASTASVLWGELFTEKDRSFLRQHLEEGNLSFGAKDTFQLEYRIVWNPEAKKQISERGETKDGKLVILLHGYGGRIINSWGWVKMVKSLWKQHFTVCLLDMPGFGRSSVNMSWNTPLQEWLHMDAVILAKFINGMNFRKSVSFIAYRESCASVMKLCTDSPHLVGSRQILVDPVFTLDDIFPIEAPYGAQMDWFQEKPSMQAVEMDRMISRKSMNFWVSFTGAPGCTSALESFKLVMNARPHLGMRISITHLSKEFICEARAGAKVSTELLFICKYIKDRFSLYLAGIEKVPKEIPPWALDVVSTNASTAIGSKAVPSVDSPAGRARNFDALETVQEAAEVLSRHTTAENFFPASKRRESALKDIPEEPIQERVVAPKKNLPKLAALRDVSGDQRGLSGFEALRQTMRSTEAAMPSVGVPGVCDSGPCAPPASVKPCALLPRIIAYMKEVKSQMEARHVPVFMVDASVGQSFGHMTREGLCRAKGMVAFCTSEYGAYTGVGYETFHELEFAHENELFPIRLCELWPPAPQNNERGTHQNRLVIKKSLVFEEDRQVGIAVKNVK
eukprot:s273_g8.t1